MLLLRLVSVFWLVCLPALVFAGGFFGTSLENHDHSGPTVGGNVLQNTTLNSPLIVTPTWSGPTTLLNPNLTGIITGGASYTSPTITTGTLTAPAVTGYAQASLPAAPSAGTLAMVTDNIRGLWVYYANQWFSLTFDEVNVKWFGAKGDGITDNTTAIQATFAAASAGAEIVFPRGTFRYTTAIAMTDKINVRGSGGRVSILAPDGVGAFTYAFTGGFGDSTIRDLGIEGTNTTAQVAIYQPGTLNDADELYGVTIRNVLIRNFNIAVKFRTVRNLTIQDSWFQDINSGIQLEGKCLGVTIDNVKIVRAAGSGIGTQYGILTNSFNYTLGTGIVSPESVRMSHVSVYGFTYGVALVSVIFADLLHSDLSATGLGVSYSTTPAILNIKDNYIEMVGAAATEGIFGADQATIINTQVNIEGNHVVGVANALATSYGVRLGTNASAGNQDNVRVVGNSFVGMTAIDIATYLSGNITIQGNLCYSTGTAYSIYAGSVPTNRPVYIDHNHTYLTIGYSNTDYSSGRVQVGANTVNQTTVSFGQAGSWGSPTFTAGDYTANGTMTFTVAAGDVVTNAYTFQGQAMRWNFSVETATVGGTLNTQLRIAVPDGKVIAKKTRTPFLYADAGVMGIGYIEALPGGTFVTLNKTSGNWSLATDTTAVWGQLSMEIQ
jgi:hypothetical protein